MVLKMRINSFSLSTASRLFVVCAIILVQKFFSAEITFLLVLFLSLIISCYFKFQRNFFRLIWPLITVLIIGIVGVLDHESRHIFRDIAFAISPILLILIGQWIAEKESILALFLNTLILLGFIFAVLHLMEFVSNPWLLSAGVVQIRSFTTGGSGSLVVLAIFLGLFQGQIVRSGFIPQFFVRYIIIPVLLASFVLSFSRTNFMVAIILTISLLGRISWTNLRFVSVFTLVIVSYIVLSVLFPEAGIGVFGSKILQSLTEITFSDYRNMSDINQNWRGYEAYMAVKAFTTGSCLQQIFGQGFGALIDVGLFMPLGDGGDVMLRFLPLTHNGYVYILVKVGLFGLALYSFFYVYVIRFSIFSYKYFIGHKKLLSRLLFGTVFSLIGTMLVVGGMAQMHQTEFVLLLGYLMRLISQYQAKRYSINTWESVV